MRNLKSINMAMSQSLQHEDELTKAFLWLCDHENEIKNHLRNFMPPYIEKAWLAGDEVKK